MISEEVGQARAERRPVVALESTIFSTLGLPSPANREALDRCEAAIRSRGAVPALTAVIDGLWRVGVDRSEESRILAATTKMAERDLGVATAMRWDVGVTTVSAAVALAHRAGLEVFATGGIGGVHRGAETTGDISADLGALASHPIVTVCAGAKAFLDLPRTLEYLETVGVPVLGWRHDWFPAFYVRSSGLRVPHRIEEAKQAAEVFTGRLRNETGVLLTVPIPEEDELDAEQLGSCIELALAECRAGRITGPAVTPFVLGRIAAVTGGRNVAANLALAENNAAVAAEVAVALASL